MAQAAIPGIDTFECVRLIGLGGFSSRDFCCLGLRKLDDHDLEVSPIVDRVYPKVSCAWRRLLNQCCCWQRMNCLKIRIGDMNCYVVHHITVLMFYSELCCACARQCDEAYAKPEVSATYY